MKKLFSIIFLITLLSGCGAEIAYKQGATPRDLQAGKVACKKAGSEIALNKCLEDNGWVIQKLGDKWLSDDDLFATATVAEGNVMQTPKPASKGIQTTDSIQVEEPAEADKVISKATAEAPPSPPVVMAKADNPKTASKSVVKEDAVIKTQPKPTTTKPKPNILDTYVIKSWWKMGGGARLLDRHMDECSAALGTAHQPNKKTFTFTRGFAICMREKGWRGLIEK